jgi:hypothetical protein
MATSEWWDHATPAQLREEMPRRSDEEIRASLVAIRGKVAMLSSLVQTSADEPDRAKRNRLKRAMGHLTETRQLLALEANQRNLRNRSVKEERKAEMIADAREALAHGRVEDALESILDILEGKHCANYDKDD